MSENKNERRLDESTGRSATLAEIVNEVCAVLETKTLAERMRRTKADRPFAPTQIGTGDEGEGSRPSFQVLASKEPVTQRLGAEVIAGNIDEVLAEWSKGLSLELQNLPKGQKAGEVLDAIRIDLEERKKELEATNRQQEREYRKTCSKLSDMQERLVKDLSGQSGGFLGRIFQGALDIPEMVECFDRREYQWLHTESMKASIFTLSKAIKLSRSLKGSLGKMSDNAESLVAILRAEHRNVSRRVVAQNWVTGDIAFSYEGIAKKLAEREGESHRAIANYVVEAPETQEELRQSLLEDASRDARRIVQGLTFAQALDRQLEVEGTDPEGRDAVPGFVKSLINEDCIGHMPKLGEKGLCQHTALLLLPDDAGPLEFPHTENMTTTTIGPFAPGRVGVLMFTDKVKVEQLDVYAECKAALDAAQKEKNHWVFSEMLNDEAPPNWVGEGSTGEVGVQDAHEQGKKAEKNGRGDTKEAWEVVEAHVSGA